MRGGYAMGEVEKWRFCVEIRFMSIGYTVYEIWIYDV